MPELCRCPYFLVSILTGFSKGLPSHFTVYSNKAVTSTLIDHSLYPIANHIIYNYVHHYHYLSNLSRRQGGIIRQNWIECASHKTENQITTETKQDYKR